MIYNYSFQHAEIQTKEIKKSKLQIPELKSVPFEELEEREKIERGKVKYRYVHSGLKPLTSTIIQDPPSPF